MPKYPKLNYRGKEFNAGIAELNNKTRQGLYIYIKEKGEKNKYYKLEEGSIEDYIDIYLGIKKEATKKEKIKETAKKKREIKAKRKEQKEEESKKKSRRRKPRKKEEKETITKAERTQEIETRGNITEKDIETMKKKLITNIMKTKEATRIQLQTSNMEKIKHRITIRATIENENGEKIASIEERGGKYSKLVKALKEITGKTAVPNSPTNNMQVNINRTAKENGIIDGIREYKKVDTNGEKIGKIKVEYILSK